jgi:hypothetical protein
VTPSPSRALRTALAAAAVSLAVPPGAAGSAPAGGPSPADGTRRATGPRFEVVLPEGAAAGPLAGRLLLVLTEDGTTEPRLQVGSGPEAVPFFGMDVKDWQPGTSRIVDAAAFGFPVRSLSGIPPGRYHVQAVLNVYEAFRLPDGRELQLPPDRGEGQQWSRKPGNPVSVPRQVEVRPGETVRVLLERRLPDVETFRETPWVKQVRIRSERLSRFWGRDVFLAALVTLPLGFHEHPQARYPLVVNHGHFASHPDGWREVPPDPGLAPDYSKRFRLAGYNRIEQQHAWELFRAWTGPGFPRVLLAQIQHPTPYYDDSYAVNSANNGPYGDAIQYELVPEIERRFRGLGQGWARFLYGGSTGGWASLAVQVFYPDEWNGAWVACPDPVDFRHYTLVNVYGDENAYTYPSRWKPRPRPGDRDAWGHVTSTLEDTALYEYALGTHGRSGEQWDAWESVFSPVGEDGYPRRIWDRLTGRIDPVTAAHWREHYDLAHVLARDWARLGPKLRGKLRLHVGEADNFYLDNAVRSLEELLRAADPPADAVVTYGPRAEHCWNGDLARPIWTSRLRYPQMVLPWAVERMLATAPPGADLTSWRY